MVILLVLLPIQHASAEPTDSSPEDPLEQGTDSQQENDWTYYFQLPFSLILIFLLMVCMMAYARRERE